MQCIRVAAQHKRSCQPSCPYTYSPRCPVNKVNSCSFYTNSKCLLHTLIFCEPDVVGCGDGEDGSVLLLLWSTSSLTVVTAAASVVVVVDDDIFVVSLLATVLSGTDLMGTQVSVSSFAGLQWPHVSDCVCAVGASAVVGHWQLMVVVTRFARVVNVVGSGGTGPGGVVVSAVLDVVVVRLYAAVVVGDGGRICSSSAWEQVASASRQQHTYAVLPL